jgi:hypothetical protein
LKLWLQVPINYTSGSAIGGGGIPMDLQRFIPNQYAKPPGFINRMAIGPMTIIPGVAFLATRHLETGDELLMDYRLNPDAVELPGWYQQFNAEEARSRWTQ